MSVPANSLIPTGDDNDRRSFGFAVVKLAVVGREVVADWSLNAVVEVALGTVPADE